MKKILYIVTVFLCLASFTACGTSSDDSSPKSSESIAKESQSQSSDIKLNDVVNWVTGDIWNKGFCDISHYVKNGKSSTGAEMDIEFTIDNLKIAYKKAEEYNDYILSLDDSIEEQAQLINAWSKMYEQIKLLYEKVVAETPRPADQSYDFDTGLFSQYFDTFYNLAMNINEPVLK